MNVWLVCANKQGDLKRKEKYRFILHPFQTSSKVIQDGFEQPERINDFAGPESNTDPCKTNTRNYSTKLPGEVITCTHFSVTFEKSLWLNCINS
jgi:hypothetical protein